MRVPSGDQIAPPPLARKRFFEPSVFMIQSDGLQLVLELVHPASRVDDLRAVGRDVRLADLLEVEVFLDGEECVGAFFLGRCARRDEGSGEREGNNGGRSEAAHTSSGKLQDNHCTPSTEDQQLDGASRRPLNP